MALTLSQASFWAPAECQRLGGRPGCRWEAEAAGGGACPGCLPLRSMFQPLPTARTRLPVPLPPHSSHLDTEKLHCSHTQSCAVSLWTPTVHWSPLPDKETETFWKGRDSPETTQLGLEP